eukprot:PhF_6_TR26421/c0_g1_i1/m.38221
MLCLLLIIVSFLCNAQNFSAQQPYPLIYTLPGPLRTQPALMDKIVYVSSPAGLIGLYNMSSASSLSSSNLTSPASVQGAVGVTLDGSILVYGGMDGIVYAMELPSGVIAWQFTTASKAYFHTTPLMLSDAVVIGSSNGTMYSLSLDDGIMRWSRVFKSPILSSAISYGSKILFGCQDKNVYAVDVNNGAILWSTATNGFVDATIVTSQSNQYAYVGSWKSTDQPGTFYAIAIDTGKIQWTVNATAKGFTQSAVVLNDVVYVPSQCGVMLSLHAQTGYLRWKYTHSTVAEISSLSSVVGGNTIYFGTWDGWLIGLDVDARQVVFRSQVEGSVTAAPLVIGDSMVVVTWKGYIYINKLNASGATSPKSSVRVTTLPPTTKAASKATPTTTVPPTPETTAEYQTLPPPSEDPPITYTPTPLSYPPGPPPTTTTSNNSTAMSNNNDTGNLLIYVIIGGTIVAIVACVLFVHTIMNHRGDDADKGKKSTIPRESEYVPLEEVPPDPPSPQSCKKEISEEDEDESVVGEDEEGGGFSTYQGNEWLRQPHNIGRIHDAVNFPRPNPLQDDIALQLHRTT